jgi:hypothetical protein
MLSADPWKVISKLYLNLNVDLVTKCYISSALILLLRLVVEISNALKIGNFRAILIRSGLKTITNRATTNLKHES